jgi:hypothetical protein
LRQQRLSFFRQERFELARTVTDEKGKSPSGLCLFLQHNT